MNNDNYILLIKKLDSFIRRYYKNQLIKGALYSVAILSAFYISLITVEYFAYFGVVVRTVMFYVYLVLLAFVAGKFLVVPLLHLYNIGSVISHEQAAKIIGQHFDEVKDKLLNILDLKALSEQRIFNSELIEASINQRVMEQKYVNYASAINFGQNKRYLKWTLIPLGIIILMLIFSSKLITEPTSRIIKHSTYFEKPAPFSFVIENSRLLGTQNEDFDLKIRIEGDEIPENIYLMSEGTEYKMEKINTVEFHYVFKNLQRDVAFELIGDDYKSKEYVVKVLKKPLIMNFEIRLNYPKYINKKDETLNNTGDLVIPAGTRVNWKFTAANTNNIVLRTQDRAVVLKNEDNVFNYGSIFTKSLTYSISSRNDYITNKDTLSYFINVIPDEFPTIKVDEYKDSVYEKHLYFKGLIKDDYGFNKLVFHYKYLNDSLANKSFSKAIEINGSVIEQSFSYFVDFSEIAKPGNYIEYYFEVWDNDGVTGSKSTRSEKRLFKSATKQELEQQAEKTDQNLKKDMEAAYKEAKKIQKQIEEISKKLIDKKTISYQEKKQIKDMLDRQKQLLKKVEDIKKQEALKTLKEQENNLITDEILEKQKELEKLMNEVMTDDIKELFEKYEKELDKLDKNKINEMLEKIKLSSKDIEKQLDRNLQLFKQLEVEKKLDNIINNLEELAKKQAELSKETETSKKDNKELQEKQKELNNEFEQIKKNIDQLEQKNKELENPNNLNKTEQEQNEIKQEQNKSSENLQNKKNKKASESQKKASEKMEELAKKFDQMKQSMQQEQSEEDYNTLRRLLNNLIKSSIAQESLMKEIQKIQTSDPKYTKLIQKQNNLKDELKMIEDSLFALSKRQVMLKSVINSEILSINNNIDKAMEGLTSRQTPFAVSRQQMAMTSMNNLALILSESLDEMQQKMDEGKKKPGDGSCNKPSGKCKKPGNGKPSLKTLRQLQEQLNKQMEQLGKKQGGTKMSQELAKLAAQQEAIRRQMQQLSDELKKDGKAAGGNLEKISKQMEQTEKDLVNRNISGETLKRQQEILTRLLESEKALQEREIEEKRESKENIFDKNSNFIKKQEYKNLKFKQDELLKTNPPMLKLFYKNKVNQYFLYLEEK